MKKTITVEVGSVWERKKGHGWLRKVEGMYTYAGIEWCRYYQNQNGYWETQKMEQVGPFKLDANLHTCTVDAMKNWGHKK